MASRPGIVTKRIYEDASPGDGHRVLIDRLWPRGVSKERAALDEWNKDVAPSDDLRRWVHAPSGPSDDAWWEEFRQRYTRELDGRKASWIQLVGRARQGRVTLLYAARDVNRNHALVLVAYLEQHLR